MANYCYYCTTTERIVCQRRTKQTRQLSATHTHTHLSAIAVVFDFIIIFALPAKFRRQLSCLVRSPPPRHPSNYTTIYCPDTRRKSLFVCKSDGRDATIIYPDGFSWFTQHPRRLLLCQISRNNHRPKINMGSK